MPYPSQELCGVTFPPDGYVPPSENQFIFLPLPHELARPVSATSADFTNGQRSPRVRDFAFPNAREAPQRASPSASTKQSGASTPYRSSISSARHWHWPISTRRKGLGVIPQDASLQSTSAVSVRDSDRSIQSNHRAPIPAPDFACKASSSMRPPPSIADSFYYPDSTRDGWPRTGTPRAEVSFHYYL